MRSFITAGFLLVFVLLTPQSQAADQCLHLTNFCDTIVLKKSGELAYGGWDWQCEGDWEEASIIGNTTNARELATRPYSPYEGGDFDTFQFVLKPGEVFDLYETDGSEIFTAQTDQPFTITNGACRAEDVDRRKPRLMFNLRPTPLLQNLSAPHCMHFRDFCDTIVLSKGVGEFALAYGAWDWQCDGDWETSNIMGNATPRYELATRPVYTAPYDFFPDRKSTRLN